MSKFCSKCGKEIDDEAVVCVGCGCEVAKRSCKNCRCPEDRDWLATLLFCLFLGGFGIHRFYTGHVGTGIIQLVLTISVIGMIITGPWVLIDLILIVTDNFKTADGRSLARYF